MVLADDKEDELVSSIISLLVPLKKSLSLISRNKSILEWLVFVQQCKCMNLDCLKVDFLV